MTWNPRTWPPESGATIAYGCLALLFWLLVAAGIVVILWAT